jgi:hypothetical protein
MTGEFDKEIDAILRRARDDSAAAAFDSHLDPDVISAFAENALPERSKQKYTAHLAECAKCRKILSNVIALNQEAAAETAFPVAAPARETASVPWYRKLFVFPQVAYTMGALVVVFGGFLGFLVLQGLTDSQNSTVSYSTEQSAPIV